MSLQVWLPLLGDSNNQGLSTFNFTVSNTSCITVDTSGKLGNCYNFNSTVANSGIYSGDSGFMSKYINNHSFSLCAWVNTSATDTGVMSLSYGLWLNAGNASNNTYIVLYNSSRMVYCYSSVGVNDGKWHHICGTYDVNTNAICFYVDGVKTGTAQYTSGYTYASSWANGLYIGRNINNSTLNDHYHYKGKLNDVRIYDHALSPKEIKEISKGLVCHYKLSDLHGEGLPNLLKYTKVTPVNQSLLGGTWSSKLTIAYIDGHNCYYYPKEQGPTWFASGAWLTSMSANTTYTYSAYIYFTADTNFTFTSLGHFQVYNSSSTASDKSHEDIVSARVYEPSTIKANTWTKVRITFTTNNLSGSYFQVYPRYAIAANVGDLYFRDCKLELGDTPTAWTPNASDNEYTQLGYNENIVYDCSGYNYHGTPSGISVSSDTPRNMISTVFDANTDTIKIKNCYALNQVIDKLSVSIWFKTNTMNSTAPNLWSLGANWFARVRLASTTALWYYLAGTSSTYSTSPTTLTDNTWHHTVFTFNSGVVVMYLDGVQIGTTDHSSTKPTLTVGDIDWYLAGYRANSENFIGSLSDFRIYSTALSADDVLELYHTGASIDKAGNMYAYEFNEV